MCFRKKRSSQAWADSAETRIHECVVDEQGFDPNVGIHQVAKVTSLGCPCLHLLPKQIGPKQTLRRSCLARAKGLWGIWQKLFGDVADEDDETRRVTSPMQPRASNARQAHTHAIGFQSKLVKSKRTQVNQSHPESTQGMLGHHTDRLTTEY